MDVFAQLVVSGILVGGVYALVAMGFIITYRSAGVFNIAYGEFAVLGAFIGWTFMGSPSDPRLPAPIAIGLTILAAVVFGLLLERFLFRRMTDKPLVAAFFVSLGFLALLQGVIMLVWGPEVRVLDKVVPAGQLDVGGVIISTEFLWSFILAVIISVAFFLFLRRTRLGLAMKAAYDNRTAARCLGVNSKLISQIAWVICCVIATIGGLLTAVTTGVSTSLSSLVMTALAVALIGGMDSLPGAIIGGLVLAVGTNLVSYYLSSYLPGIEAVFNMMLILIVLMIRPTGIMGSRVIERV